MKMSFLSNKCRTALLASLALLCVVMIVLALLVDRGGYDNLLLAAPLSYFGTEIDLENIERFCEDEFLVTYELPFLCSVSNGSNRYELTGIATNNIWSSINACRMISGSFFTKGAYDTKARHAVLNRSAAFAIFGGNNIAGKTLKIQYGSWIITGVIDDGDDEAGHIYIPSSTGALLGLSGGSATVLLALLDPTGGIDELYAKHALKSLGLREDRYTCINLQKAAGMYWERLFVVLQCAFCLIQGSAACLFFSKLKLYTVRVIGFSKKLYAREVFRTDPALTLKLVMNALLCAAAIVLCTVLLMRIILTGLSWRAVSSLQEVPAFTHFAVKLKALQDYAGADLVVFIALLGILILNAGIRLYAYKGSHAGKL
ncbi:MAG: ABC transporter permease [Spirochaetaceae bacterium]|jgi:hypothetical protein|nr:ABC transporter permease [Spirochaetaceae bacterium]